MPELNSEISVSWGQRLLRRAAWSVAGVVALAGLAPALANAAGANVPNPVVVALRGYGDTLVDAVAPEDTDSACPGAAKAKKGKPKAKVCAQPAESPEPTSEAAEDDTEHGRIVSTVAHCAPRGKDPLLAVEGAPANHGTAVRAAAHGEPLRTPWGTFDLSTMTGATAFCAAVDTARAALPSAGPDAKAGQRERPKKQHPLRPKPHGGHPKPTGPSGS